MDKDADAFYQKRVPKGAPDYLETATDHLPFGPHRRRDLSDRDRRTGLVRAHGHAHLPPLAGAPRRRRPPRRAAHRPRPAARYVVHRRGARRRRRAGAPRGAGPHRLREVRRATAACTSMCASSRGGSSSTCGTPPSASAASSRNRDDGVTAHWWKEERGERIFVDYNQNCRDRTIASAYSLRPIPGAPVSTPMTWEELAGVTDPRRVQPLHGARAPAEDGDPWASIDDVTTTSRRCSSCSRSRASVELQLPARLPEDARRASQGAAEPEEPSELGR